jgi:hypothetical protein
MIAAGVAPARLWRASRQIDLERVPIAKVASTFAEHA